MRLLSETESWLRTTRITPRALAGLNELPRDERAATLSILAIPFRQNRTEKMAQRKDIALWRVRVNRDVRLTFRLEDGFPLVLHIGRHQPSDDFVERYREADEFSESLEEVESMKSATKIARVSMNGNSASSLMNETTLGNELIRILGEIAGRTAGQEQQASGDLALDEVDRINAEMKELADQVAQLTLEREESLEIGSVTPVNVTGCQRQQHELQVELLGCLSRLDELTRRLSHARSDLQAQMNAMLDQVASLTEDVAWLKEQQRQRQNGWLQRLFRTWWR